MLAGARDRSNRHYPRSGRTHRTPLLLQIPLPPDPARVLWENWRFIAVSLRRHFLLISTLVALLVENYFVKDLASNP